MERQNADRLGSVLLLLGILMVVAMVLVPARSGGSSSGMLHGVQYLVNGGQPLGTAAGN